MSKMLPAEQRQLRSFIDLSVRNQREQLNAMELILQEINGVEERVNDKLVKVEKIESKMEELAKQITDENRLLPAEIDDLWVAVRDKSTELAKHRHTEDEDKFSRVVGKYRKNIWSKMKRKFGTSKYIHLKRVDFPAAMEFVENFDPEDYL